MVANQTFFFYDVETTGLSPRYDRIMQFAGQRTDINFKPIGKPVNFLVKLTDDVLPNPVAIAVTGITPQQTLRDGLAEAELAKILQKEVFTPGTISVGYNNIRFDDEFMRSFFWRNFYDPYEWQWSEGRSRWDLLDVVRSVRALRPDGISWPFVSKDGKKVPTNTLELLTKQNKLEHAKAHDALSDVVGLIEVAKLLKSKQPKIFEYLFENRGKKEVQQLVNLDDPKPFVYTSGRYAAEREKTTVATPVAPGKNSGTILVYDLLKDITDYKDWKREDFAEAALPRYKQKNSEDPLCLPVKELNYGRCPSVAPLGVLDADCQKRLDISLEQVQKNLEKLKKNQGILDKIIQAWREKPDYQVASDTEGQLYQSFTPDADKPRVKKVPELSQEDLADFQPEFSDERLPELFFRYKARNFPKSLSESEQKKWSDFKAERFNSQIENYVKDLQKIQTDGADDFVVQELQLWAESICPNSEEM
ncbi:exodeoxyribonuclease I [Candidatus Saccharibacteria bacterium]|nr:exodeoxyribonuclease I [Candidatus Saccharibacteria bacterium]